MVKRKNWWIWSMVGFLALAVLCSVENWLLKLILLVVEFIGLGVGLYKLNKGED